MIVKILLLIFNLLFALFWWNFIKDSLNIVFESRFDRNVSLFFIAFLVFGFCRYLFSRFQKIKDLFMFIDTLEHELTHIAMGLLFLKFPKSLTIKSSGDGLVELGGGNLMIYLAPYFIPLWIVISLIFYKIIDWQYQNLFPLLVGALWANFIYRMRFELHPAQTDFQKSGFLNGVIFSVLMVSFWLLASLLFFVKNAHQFDFAAHLQYVFYHFIDMLKSSLSYFIGKTKI